MTNSGAVDALESPEDLATTVAVLTRENARLMRDVELTGSRIREAEGAAASRLAEVLTRHTRGQGYALVYLGCADFTEHRRDLVRMLQSEGFRADARDFPAFPFDEAVERAREYGWTPPDGWYVPALGEAASKAREVEQLAKENAARVETEHRMEIKRTALRTFGTHVAFATCSMLTAVLIPRASLNATLWERAVISLPAVLGAVQLMYALWSSVVATEAAKGSLALGK